jgi:hypothetical protein
VAGTRYTFVKLAVHPDAAISKVASFRQERRIHPAGHLITRARCRMNAAFPSQCPGTPNEPFPPPLIETFSEINVVASVAIGWQRKYLT